MQRNKKKLFICVLAIIIFLISSTLFAENNTQTSPGGSLYDKAIFDQQKKDEENKVIIKFLQALPSAYKISILNLQTQNNGDGTANITFQVNLELDCTVTPNEKKERSYGQYYHHVTRIPGIDLNELWLAGLDITSSYPYSPPSFKDSLQLQCEQDKCKKLMDFVCKETKAKPLFLYMTAGQQHNAKMQLNYPYNCERGSFAFATSIDSRRRFTIKNVPLPELKEISTVQAKVIYLDRRAFPKNDRDFIGSN